MKNNPIEPNHYIELVISPLEYITKNEGEFTWCIGNVIKYVSGKYVIIIWTARMWCDAPNLISWLEKYSIPYHGIKMNKGASDIYIDDKAMLPEKENLKNLLDNDIKLEMW